MSIRPLSREEFEAFEPMRTEALGAEQAWFADSGDNVIGTVILDHTDKDWAFVVLGRDENGHFRGIELKASVASQTEAEAQLIAAMARVESSGETVFAQGD